MNNPLASSVGPGYFRRISEKNRESDLSRITDSRKDQKLVAGNKSEFPSKIFVINLDSRPDRWEFFKEHNQSLFDKFQVERFPAISGDDVPLAIFNSYISCMEHAFASDETVIIMEDDAYLVDGWEAKLDLAFNDLPEDWDVLIGNHYFFGHIELLSDHIAKPNGNASTINFALYRRSILDKIRCNMHLREGDKLDIDHFITSPDTPILNYTIWPMISREYASFSDHKKSVKDMTVRIRGNANLFQFIDSETYYPSLEGW